MGFFPIFLHNLIPQTQTQISLRSRLPNTNSSPSPILSYHSLSVNKQTNKQTDTQTTIHKHTA
jgi:hypothetical protein